jgi:hypothetical protein
LDGDVYERVSPGAVSGSNGDKYPDQTPESCAKLCHDTAGCDGFEFGFPHGGSKKTYKSNTCILAKPGYYRKGISTATGSKYNLDFYVRLGGGTDCTSVPNSVWDPASLSCLCPDGYEGILTYPSGTSGISGSWSGVCLEEGETLPPTAFAEKPHVAREGQFHIMRQEHKAEHEEDSEVPRTVRAFAAVKADGTVVA